MDLDLFQSSFNDCIKPIQDQIDQLNKRIDNLGGKKKPARTKRPVRASRKVEIAEIMSKT